MNIVAVDGAETSAARIVADDNEGIMDMVCPPHSINLLFKDFSKHEEISDILERSHAANIFFANHHKTRGWLKEREAPKSKRPAETRWMTKYLVLERIFQVKDVLKEVVADRNWDL